MTLKDGHGKWGNTEWVRRGVTQMIYLDLGVKIVSSSFVHYI